MGKKSGKYVAYVGTYTHANSVGIYVYDVDPDKGILTERSVCPINNPSYLCISKDGKFLYSIADEGVAAFSIDENGDLTKINQQWIGGMRGCYVEVDSQRRCLFVGGYHDGRVTMMRLNPDGSIGDIACGIFHQGVVISTSEHRLDHPKVTSVKLSPDEKYLLAADLGLNQIKVYRIDYKNGNLKLEDIIRCELDAGPRAMGFSADGKFLYVLTQLNNEMAVYTYEDVDDEPQFKMIQSLSVLDGDFPMAESSCFKLNKAENYILVTIDAANQVTFLKRNPEDGTLSYAWETPVSGDFPKSLVVLPGDKYYVTLNHDTNEIRSFLIDYEKGYALMMNAPVKVDKPNVIKIHQLV